MKKVVLTLVTACALLVSGIASADNLKIGVLDLKQVMQKSNDVAKINAQLAKEFQPRQDKIIAAQKNLQAEADQLNKNSTTMSDADRNKLQDQIIADRSNVQGMALEFQRDVSAAQNQALQKFMAQLNDVVASVAKTGGYDLVMQRGAALYINNNLDITSQVITALNKNS